MARRRRNGPPTGLSLAFLARGGLHTSGDRIREARVRKARLREWLRPRKIRPSRGMGRTEDERRWLREDSCVRGMLEGPDSFSRCRMRGLRGRHGVDGRGLRRALSHGGQ
jgi:hypothetical protein